MNLNYVALPIRFEVPGKDPAGNYRSAGSFVVRVESDGETVTFTLPDGQRWHCDREPIAAVVRERAV